MEAAAEYNPSLLAGWGLGQRASRLLSEIHYHPNWIESHLNEIATPSVFRVFGPDSIPSITRTLLVNDRYNVLFITATGIVPREKSIAAATLNSKIEDFRKALSDPKLDPRPLGEQLFHLLIDPIAADLEQAHAETLIVSLDGVLRYLPFAALFDGNHYLVEKYAIASFTPESLQYLTWIIHEQTLILKKAAKLGALARGVFEAFDTLSFLIEVQNMVQVPVLTGFYAF